MAVELIKVQENAEQKKSLITPAKIGRWIGSIRVSYPLVVAVACWLVLASFLVVLQLAGLIDAR